MANAKLITQVLGSVQNQDQFEQVISALQDCKYYAYIYHDSDIKENGELKTKHLHFVAEDRHSLKNWAELFGLPENMIEICRGFRASNRYLIHIDDNDKFQYKFEDIKTNRPLRLKSYFEDNQELNPSCLFNDLIRVQKGQITRTDFIQKYEYFLQKQSFYCQFRIYQELAKYEQQ